MRCNPPTQKGFTATRKDVSQCSNQDGSSVTEGPKTPAADKDTQMNAPDACEREPELVCESVDIPLFTSTTVEDGIKGSSEAVPIGSSESPDELECEAKILDASHVCVELPENVSESLDQALVIMINQGDSVEGLSEARPLGSTESPESSKSKAKVADASQVSGTIPEVASENTDQPPVNMAVEGDDIDGLSEAGPMGSLETPEESKSEAKVGDTCQVSGTMPENAFEDMDIQPSLTAEEGRQRQCSKDDGCAMVLQWW